MREQYEESLKSYWDMVNVINTSFEEGEQVGIEKGEQIGLEKGEQIGVGKEKIKTACQMLKDDIPIELITKYTGLTVEEISNLTCD